MNPEDMTLAEMIEATEKLAKKSAELHALYNTKDPAEIRAEVAITTEKIDQRLKMFQEAVLNRQKYNS